LIQFLWHFSVPLLPNTQIKRFSATPETVIENLALGSRNLLSLKTVFWCDFPVFSGEA